MVRWLRRTIVLAIITAVAFTLVRRARRAVGEPAIAPPSAWPPFEPRVVGDVLASTTAAVADWVAPVGGDCPDGYSVKANDNSHIFHVPGGRSYDRTRPERCYATAEAAERDGYRRAKT